MQHAVVDDVRGVVLDVEVTTGQQRGAGRAGAYRRGRGRHRPANPHTATADAGCAYGKI